MHSQKNTKLDMFIINSMVQKHMYHWSTAQAFVLREFSVALYTLGIHVVFNNWEQKKVGISGNLKIV
jgi:hypothetical protein